jgi:hypothetical protein
VTVLRASIGIGVLLYAGLWVIAVNGATMLVPILTVPVVLAVLIAGGNYLSQYLGLPARKQRFEDRETKP